MNITAVNVSNLIDQSTIKLPEVIQLKIKIISVSLLLINCMNIIQENKVQRKRIEVVDI
jgi:hypothetical protein